MPDLVNDPYMLVDDTSVTGNSADGEISWTDSNWEKSSGALRQMGYGPADDFKLTINLGNLMEVGKTYAAEYRISGLALNSLTDPYLQDIRYIIGHAKLQPGTHRIEWTETTPGLDICIYGNVSAAGSVIEYFKVYDTMAESNLYSTLSGFSGLTSLVGTRIYPLVIPQDSTFPAVTYQRITGQRVLVMDDNGGNAPERILFQLSSWAKTMQEASDVSEQVRLALASADYEVVPQTNRATYDAESKLYGMEYDFAMWHHP